MANAPIAVSAEGAAALGALSRRLKDAGRGDLQKQLRREIRDAGRPVITDIRQAVMNVDVSSSRGGTARPDRSTGLRARTAKATGLSVTKRGIRIRVRGKRVDPQYPSLVKYLDGTLGKYGRWRHPVFWPGPIGTAPARRVVQQSGEAYFFVTINKHRRQFRRAVFEAIERTNEQITSG